MKKEHTMERPRQFRFRYPTPEERDLVFDLIEPRGDRGLFGAVGLQGWTIPPTFVYLMDDMEPITEKETE